MRFGVCGDAEVDAEVARTAKAAGYDYWEPTVPWLLRPRESETAFQERLVDARSVGLPTAACNVFVPPDLKIVGPDADPAALKDYVDTVMDRAARAGVRVIVFGSAGARKRPDGFDAEKARIQVVHFAAMAARSAAPAGVTLAVEPLNPKETNTINTVADGARLVRDVDLPAFRLLVDSYHWEQEPGGPGDLSVGRGLFVHTHTATAANRLAPGREDYDFTPFFRRLVLVGYDGGVSLEGDVGCPAETLAPALAMLKKAAAAAR
jgi:sugar phosphate isomerase/epimerase